MSGIKQVLLWARLLCKRLYKKVTFLLILLLIPLLTVGFGILAKEDSGVITVALAREDTADVLSGQIIDELLEDRSLVRFLSCDSPEEAETAVRSGKADGAWIFPASMEENVLTFLTHESADYSIVRVLEREQTVALRLAREKLSKILFECCADDYFLNFVRSNATTLEEMTDEEILAYYDNAFYNGELFSVSYIDSQQTADETSGVSYLMAPLRGLLSVLIVLCGLATAMYYTRDLQAGLFSWFPERRLYSVEFGYQTVSLVNVSVAVLIALSAVGLTGSVWREIVVLLLYCVCVASFCCFMRALCGNLKRIGVLMPLLVVVMIAVCPVFFDLKVQKVPGLFFPPTYYLNSLHNDRYVIYMLLYTVIFWFLYRIIGLMRSKRIFRICAEK